MAASFSFFERKKTLEEERTKRKKSPQACYLALSLVESC
jgi:hypothetical protein